MEHLYRLHFLSGDSFIISIFYVLLGKHGRLHVDQIVFTAQTLYHVCIQIPIDENNRNWISNYYIVYDFLETWY